MQMNVKGYESSDIEIRERMGRELMNDIPDLFEKMNLREGVLRQDGVIEVIK